MTIFTLSLLQSYDSLKGFFSQSPDIGRIAHWQLLNDEDLSPPQQATNGIYGTLIGRAYNGPNEEGSIINEQPPILVEQLSDTRVVKRTFFSIHDGQILFDHQLGICRGMSIWFLTLYLKTSHLFSLPKVHMAALSEQFEQGGGMEATLLQTLDVHNGKLLDLKIGNQPHKHDARFERKRDCIPILKFSFEQWVEAKPAVTHAFEDWLPNGAYLFRLQGHNTAWIKISYNLSYFFDPNFGVFEVKGALMGSDLVRLIDQSMDDAEISINDPFLEIVPVTLRSLPYDEEQRG